MKIFITGGIGFIGCPVVLRLRAAGHELALLVHQNGSVKGALAIRGDLADPSSYRDALADFHPDVALHLAWGGIPDYSWKNSADNLKWSISLFSVLSDIGCKKIIGVGTGWEYGAFVGRANEDQVANPKKIIAVSKYAVGRFGEELAKERGLVFVWARPFFVYGPGQKPSSLMPSILSALETGSEPILKTPDAAQDFIFVDDVAEALVRLSTQEVPGGIYNIGSGKLTSVAAVANLFFAAFKKNTRLPEPDCSRPNARMYADISKIKKTVGWHPTVSIAQGIEQMIAAYPND